MKGLWNGALRLVSLQFICGLNEKRIEGLFEKPRENVDQLIKRVSGVKGEKKIDSTRDVSLLEFPLDLTHTGYGLVDAFRTQRTNAAGKLQWICKFIFAVPDERHNEGEFPKHREQALVALTRLCNEMLWSVEAYLNPFFKNGELVEGAKSASINLALPTSLVDGEGQPILRAQKDEDGRRIYGAPPIPIQPKLQLRITEDEDVRVVGMEEPAQEVAE